MKFKEYKILALDTSCDETSAAVVFGTKVLSNVMPSQEFHSQYGGVVPSLAKLAHIERIDSVVKKALERSKTEFEDLDAIAVTYGPGLAIALEIGIKKAKELAILYNKPLIAINHMEGHLVSGFAQRNSLNVQNDFKCEFPALGVLISGGHTELIEVNSFTDYKKIGETLDDACGECFDKCGRMLGLGYPAGPVISKFAKEHRSNVKIKIVKSNQGTYVIGANSKTQYSLPIPMLNSGDLNFSFSGLKTAFKELIAKSGELTKEKILDLCVVFEAAALNQVVFKVEKALNLKEYKEIWLGGGVVASSKLRSLIRKVAQSMSIKLRYPSSKKLTGDNAAMIGVAANIRVNYSGLKHNPEKGIYFSAFEKIDREPSVSL